VRRETAIAVRLTAPVKSGKPKIYSGVRSIGISPEYCSELPCFSHS
jgi:hypothetical protein